MIIPIIASCSGEGQPSKLKVPEKSITLDCGAAGRKISIYITKGIHDITIIENNKVEELPLSLQIVDKFYLINIPSTVFGGNSEKWKINRATLGFQIQLLEKVYDGNCELIEKPRL
jgi:hypothetical protein